MIRVQDGDTLYMAWLHEVWVYPPMKFKNKKQQRFYWRTVRDVKKCLPYAKMITKDMYYADQELAKLPDNKSRKKWWHTYERYLFKKYEKDFRGMYASQGMMLMKLMDRETDKTSYELIKQYKGKAAANFWQFVALQERPQRGVRCLRQRPHHRARDQPRRSGTVIKKFAYVIFL